MVNLLVIGFPATLPFIYKFCIVSKIACLTSIVPLLSLIYEKYNVRNGQRSHLHKASLFAINLSQNSCYEKLFDDDLISKSRKSEDD